MSALKNFEQEIETYIKPITLPLAIKLLTLEKRERIRHDETSSK